MLSAMTGPERKSKKHPTFQYLPKNRGISPAMFTFYGLTHAAKKLKRSWVDSKKLKSQWKAQKKREGIWSKSSSQPDNYGGETATQTCPAGLSDPLVDSDRKVTDDILPVGEHSTEASTTNKVSLRELKRQAYSPSTLHNHKSDPRKRRGADTSSPHKREQESLRMNAVLEKIKRDLC
ncbi:hypothetical protein F5141DRAFT_1115526 [Pisolithus sp. B1]|nr:hypothetical protein F5141DRAFT_1115526 [Pisolithus sp. B1]